jgi:hypothetical protein
MIALQAPAGLLSQLQAGDRVEVVIHKKVNISMAYDLQYF